MRLSGRIYDWQLPLERAALATAAELAAVRPGERLLDLATGTGGLLHELVARGVRPGEAVGIDRSPSMLAVAAPASRADGLSSGATPDDHPLKTVASMSSPPATYFTCSLPMTGYGWSARCPGCSAPGARGHG